MRMKLSDFNYELPEELVAEYPNKNRDEAKLMVIDRKDYSIQHRQFKDMIEYFARIVNMSKEIPISRHKMSEQVLSWQKFNDKILLKEISLTFFLTLT